eukprot:4165318-Prymnesium_polylepis.1
MLLPARFGRCARTVRARGGDAIGRDAVSCAVRPVTYSGLAWRRTLVHFQSGRAILNFIQNPGYPTPVARGHPDARRVE